MPAVRKSGDDEAPVTEEEPPEANWRTWSASTVDLGYVRGPKKVSVSLDHLLSGVRFLTSMLERSV